MTSRLSMLRWAAAALLAATTAAHADLIGMDTHRPVISASQDSAATGYTAWLGAAPQVGTAVALAVTSPKTSTRLAATAAAVGSVTLPVAGTANLWTFITVVRAQQRGETFAQLETNVSLFQLTEPAPSQVPLPAAVWFLVMGLLGVAGVRLTAREPLGATRHAGLAPAGA